MDLLVACGFRITLLLAHLSLCAARNVWYTQAELSAIHNRLALRGSTTFALEPDTLYTIMKKQCLVDLCNPMLV